MLNSFIADDALYRERCVSTKVGDVYITDANMILTKEEFLMCYEAWVLKAKEEGEKDAE